MSEWVWVKINQDGIIIGASVDDGRAKSLRFLHPVYKGNRILRVKGPVRMSAHIDAPMVYPPVLPAPTEGA